MGKAPEQWHVKSRQFNGLGCDSKKKQHNRKWLLLMTTKMMDQLESVRKCTAIAPLIGDENLAVSFVDRDNIFHRGFIQDSKGATLQMSTADLFRIIDNTR